MAVRFSRPVSRPNKAPIARRAALPDYAHSIAKRSKSGGRVTSQLVAKLLKGAG